jgi:DNA-binding transcriptional regulator YiaG
MSKELKNKLQSLRAILGLSQSQLAAKLGVPVQTLQAWEADRRTPRGFALSALNAQLDALLAGK